MAQINLLPWREQARQAKRVRFMITLGIFVGITLILVLIWHMYIANQINLQKQRNTYLQLEFDQTQSEVSVLKIKQKDQIALMAELHFIMNLRESSFRVMTIIKELANTVPGGVSLNKIEYKDNMITVAGKAKSSSLVTAFMKKIAERGYFAQPDLTEISADQKEQGEEKFFQLTIMRKE